VPEGPGGSARFQKQRALLATRAPDGPQCTSRRHTIRSWPEPHCMLGAHNRCSPTGWGDRTPAEATVHAHSRFPQRHGRS
jgi:hypothetical protein